MWLKKIQLAFFLTLMAVLKQFQNNLFRMYVVWREVVGYWCLSGWKRLFFPFIPNFLIEEANQAIQ